MTRNKHFNSVEEACLAVNVLPKKPLIVGRYYRSDVLNDSKGKNDASICLINKNFGFVRNWKTDQTVYFHNVCQIQTKDNELLAQLELIIEKERQYHQQVALAKRIWRHSSALTEIHAYLARKKVRANENLRVINAQELISLLGYLPSRLKGKTLLVVPKIFEQELCSLEFIDELGFKTSLPRARAKEAYWPATDIPNSWNGKIFVGEGVATVLSFMEHHDGYGVACFGCYNFLPTVMSLRNSYPNAQISLLADIGNGVKSAIQTAIKTQCPCLVPPFSPSQKQLFAQITGKEPTDWNDFYFLGDCHD